jgi:hypothetical protein
MRKIWPVECLAQKANWKKESSSDCEGSDCFREILTWINPTVSG